MPITKQTIAIIGADGNIGSSIAKCISSGNYRLLLFSDEVSSVQPLVEEITQSDSSADIDVRDCKFDACWEADIIIMAVPNSAQEEVAKIIEEVATQKIVIKIVNSENKTLNGSKTSQVAREVEELQELLPHSKIMAVFNTDFTQSKDGKQANAFLAGDDEDALEAVSELVQIAGFNPVIAENLSGNRAT